MENLESVASINKNRVIVIPLFYSAIIVGAFFILPPNPDEITVPMELVQGFRIASAFTMSIFWGLLGLILGAFWDRLNPTRQLESPQSSLTHYYHRMSSGETKTCKIVV